MSTMCEPHRGSWSVYAICSLCSGRTSHHRHDDPDVARAACDEEALRLGWRSLPEVRGERRRSAGWLCRECCADVLALAAAEASS